MRNLLEITLQANNSFLTLMGIQFISLIAALVIAGIVSIVFNGMSAKKNKKVDGGPRSAAEAAGKKYDRILSDLRGLMYANAALAGFYALLYYINDIPVVGNHVVIGFLGWTAIMSAGCAYCINTANKTQKNLEIAQEIMQKVFDYMQSVEEDREVSVNYTTFLAQCMSFFDRETIHKIEAIGTDTSAPSEAVGKRVVRAIVENAKSTNECMSNMADNGKQVLEEIQNLID